MTFSKSFKVMGIAILAGAGLNDAFSLTASAAKPGGGTTLPYLLTELGDSNPQAVSSPDSNRRLLIGGAVAQIGTGYNDAALWSADAVTGAVLGNSVLDEFPGGNETGIWAINDAGFAVGSADVLTNGELPWANVAFVNVPGVGTRLLTTTEDAYGAAWGINNLGDVVGDKDYRGALWHVGADGTVTGYLDLGAFLPRDINDWGLMAGSYNSHPAIAWFEAGALQVEELSTTNDVAKAVNNLGDVVGGPFLWHTATGTTTNLGSLGGIGTGAWDINDNGQVVGWSYNRQGQTRAFLWQNGTLSDLNALVGFPNDGIKRVLQTARGINNSSHIVGLARLDSKAAFGYRGCLLTLKP